MGTLRLLCPTRGPESETPGRFIAQLSAGAVKGSLGSGHRITNERSRLMTEPSDPTRDHMPREEVTGFHYRGETMI